MHIHNNCTNMFCHQKIFAWWEQANAYTNVDQPSVSSCGIHMRAISHQLLEISIVNTSLRIIDLSWHPFFPGTNELISASVASHTLYQRRQWLDISVSRWRHQMKTFSALLALCAGNSPVTVNSPHKGQWRGTLMFSLICAQINDWVNNREAGDLRRHRGHYDIIVMTWDNCLPCVVMNDSCEFSWPSGGNLQ